MLDPIKGNPPETRPPYYGTFLAARAIGKEPNTRILQLETDCELETAYAFHNGENLRSIVAINFQEWNSTSIEPRPSKTFEFRVGHTVKKAKVERLKAAGAEVTEGITVAGLSFDYNLEKGKPVVIDAEEEWVNVTHGDVSVEIPATEAVLLRFE